MCLNMRNQIDIFSISVQLSFCLIHLIVADTTLDLSEMDERIKIYDVPFRDVSHYVTIMLFGGLNFRPETSDPEVCVYSFIID